MARGPPGRPSGRRRAGHADLHDRPEIIEAATALNLSAVGYRLQVTVMIGGTLLVWSPDGGGTRVRAELPCG